MFWFLIVFPFQPKEMEWCEGLNRNFICLKSADLFESCTWAVQRSHNDHFNSWISSYNELYLIFHFIFNHSPVFCYYHRDSCESWTHTHTHTQTVENSDCRDSIQLMKRKHRLNSNRIDSISYFTFLFTIAWRCNHINVNVAYFIYFSSFRRWKTFYIHAMYSQSQRPFLYCKYTIHQEINSYRVNNERRYCVSVFGFWYLYTFFVRSMEWRWSELEKCYLRTVYRRRWIKSEVSTIHSITNNNNNNQTKIMNKTLNGDVIQYKGTQRKIRKAPKMKKGKYKEWKRIEWIGKCFCVNGKVEAKNQRKKQHPSGKTSHLLCIS